MASVPPRSSARDRDRHEVADRREEDRSVERLGRSVVRVAGRRSAELEREPLRVGRSCEHVHRCALEQRDLRSDVRRRTEPVDAEPPAAWQARSSKRSIPDDPGAEQRRGVLVVEPVGQRVRVALVDDGPFGVAAVVVPSREPGRDAQVLVAAHAEATHAAGVAQPRDPDAVADREPRRARAARVDSTDDLVTGHDTEPPRLQVALGEVEIGPADAAHADRDADLARPPASGRRVPRARADAWRSARGCPLPMPARAQPPAASGGAISSGEGSEREGSDASCASWNRSTLRNDGNSFDHVAATTSVIAPPNTTAGRDAEQLACDAGLERTELVRRADEDVLDREHTSAR